MVRVESRIAAILSEACGEPALEFLVNFGRVAVWDLGRYVGEWSLSAFGRLSVGEIFVPHDVDKWPKAVRECIRKRGEGACFESDTSS